jgi:transposase
MSMANVTALPEQARRVLERVQRGDTAKDIATDLGISRNAVYQQIGKLRRQGHLPAAEGQRPRRRDTPDLTVDSAIAGFAEQLRHQLEAIAERSRTLEKELEWLLDERRKVIKTLELLGLEQPRHTRQSPSREG